MKNTILKKVLQECFYFFLFTFSIQAAVAGNYDPINNRNQLLNPDSVLTIQLTPFVYPNGYNVSCFGFKDGSIDLSVTGGTTPYTYLWSTGATTQDITALESGLYIVTVTDADSNVRVGSVTLNQPAQLKAIEADGEAYEFANGYNISCINCFNGSIDVTVSGGTGSYLYEWKDGPTTQDRANLGKGEYIVIVKDASECSNGENVRINFKLIEPPVDNWKMSGNSGTNPNNQFIGTTDNTAFTFKTNNSERLRINGNGNIGIGTNNPTEKLHLVGNGKITDNFNVGKKMTIMGSLKIDSLAGEGFYPDSMSTRSYKILLANDKGEITAMSPLFCGGIRPVFYGGDYFGVGQVDPTVGTCNNRDFNLITNSQKRITIKGSDGYVGIGTTTPLSMLHIVLPNNTPLASAAAIFSLQNDAISPQNSELLICPSNDINSYNGITRLGDAGIFWNDHRGSANSRNQNAGFVIAPHNISGEEGIRIDASGKVSIGTKETFTEYLLAVNGKIICTELMVKLYQDWPDFVFEKKYDLMPLAEVEQYINQHKHLPSVPSATDVEKNGVALGQNQAILLQKIEELTLYVIELNKKNEQLQKEVNELKNSK